jgi:phage-related protein
MATTTLDFNFKVNDELTTVLKSIQQTLLKVNKSFEKSNKIVVETFNEQGKVAQKVTAQTKELVKEEGTLIKQQQVMAAQVKKTNQQFSGTQKLISDTSKGFKETQEVVSKTSEGFADTQKQVGKANEEIKKSSGIFETLKSVASSVANSFLFLKNLVLDLSNLFLNISRAVSEFIATFNLREAITSIKGAVIVVLDFRQTIILATKALTVFFFTLKNGKPITDGFFNAAKVVAFGIAIEALKRNLVNAILVIVKTLAINPRAFLALPEIIKRNFQDIEAIIIKLRSILSDLFKSVLSGNKIGVVVNLIKLKNTLIGASDQARKTVKEINGNFQKIDEKNKIGEVREILQAVFIDQFKELGKQVGEFTLRLGIFGLGIKGVADEFGGIDKVLKNTSKAFKNVSSVLRETFSGTDIVLRNFIFTFKNGLFTFDFFTGITAKLAKTFSVELSNAFKIAGKESLKLFKAIAIGNIDIFKIIDGVEKLGLAFTRGFLSPLSVSNKTIDLFGKVFKGTISQSSNLLFTFQAVSKTVFGQLASDLLKGQLSVDSLNKAFGIFKKFAVLSISEISASVGKDLSRLVTSIGRDFGSLAKSISPAIKGISNAFKGGVESLLNFNNVVRKASSTFDFIRNSAIKFTRSIVFLDTNIFGTIKSLGALGIVFEGLGQVLRRSESETVRFTGELLAFTGVGIISFTTALKKAIKEVAGFARELGRNLSDALQSSVELFSKADAQTFKFQRNIEAFGKVFDGSVASVEEWNGQIEKLSKEIGVLPSELQLAASEIVAVGASSKLSQDQMFELLKVSSDYAALLKRDVVTTSIDFLKALNGSADGVVKFGVKLNEGAVSQKIFGDETGKALGKLSAAEKVQARYQALLKQYKPIAGLASDVTATLAGQQKLYETNLKRLNIALGQGANIIQNNALEAGALNLVLNNVNETVLKAVGFFGSLASIVLRVGGFILENVFAVLTAVQAYRLLNFFLGASITQTAFSKTIPILNNSIYGLAETLGFTRGSLTNFGSLLKDLPKIIALNARSITASLLGISAANVTLSTTFGILATTIKTSLVSAFKLLLATTKAFLLNPIVLTTTAIAASIIALVKVIQEIEERTGAFSTILGVLNDLLGFGISSFAGLGSAIKDKFTSALNAAAGVVDKFFGFLVDKLSAIIQLGIELAAKNPFSVFSDKQIVELGIANAKLEKLRKSLDETGYSISKIPKPAEKAKRAIASTIDKVAIKNINQLKDALEKVEGSFDDLEKRARNFGKTQKQIIKSDFAETNRIINESVRARLIDQEKANELLAKNLQDRNLKIQEIENKRIEEVRKQLEQTVKEIDKSASNQIEIERKASESRKSIIKNSFDDGLINRKRYQSLLEQEQINFEAKKKELYSKAIEEEQRKRDEARRAQLDKLKSFQEQFTEIQKNLIPKDLESQLRQALLQGTAGADLVAKLKLDIEKVVVRKEAFGAVITTAQQIGSLLTGGAANFVKNIIPAIIKIRDTFNNLSVKAKAQLGKLFSGDLFSKLKKGISGLFSDSGTSSAVGKALGTVVKTIGAAFESIATVIAGPFGELIGGLFSIVTDIFGAAPDKFNEMIDGLIRGIPRILANILINTVSLMSGKLIGEVLRKLVDDLPGIFQELGMALAENFASPIFWTDAVVGFTFAFIGAIPEMIKGFVQGFINGIKDAFGKVGKFFKVIGGLGDTGKKIGSGFSKAGDKTKSFFSKIGDGFKSAFSKIKDLFGSLFNKLKEAFSFLKDFASKAFEKIKEVFSKVFDLAKEAPKRVFEAFKKAFDIVKSLPGKIVGGLKDLPRAIFDKLKNAFSAIPKLFKALFGNFFTFFKDALKSVFKLDFKNLLGSFKNLGAKIFEGFRDLFTKFNPINFLSKIFKLDNKPPGVIERLLGINFPFVKFAKGGLVGGKQVMGPDAERFDKVPSLLSEGEIVLPKTIVNSGIDGIVKFVSQFGIKDLQEGNKRKIGEDLPLKRNIFSDILGAAGSFVSGFTSSAFNLVSNILDSIGLGDVFRGGLEQIFGPIKSQVFDLLPRSLQGFLTPIGEIIELAYRFPELMDLVARLLTVGLVPNLKNLLRDPKGEVLRIFSRTPILDKALKQIFNPGALLKGIPGLQEGGTIPRGFNNDNFVAGLSSGETVVTQDLSNRLDSFLSRQERSATNETMDTVKMETLFRIAEALERPTEASASVEFDQEVLANIMLNISRSNQRTA